MCVCVCVCVCVFVCELCACGQGQQCISTSNNDTTTIMILNFLLPGYARNEEGQKLKPTMLKCPLQKKKCDKQTQNRKPTMLKCPRGKKEFKKKSIIKRQLTTENVIFDAGVYALPSSTL